MHHTWFTLLGPARPGPRRAAGLRRANGRASRWTCTTTVAAPAATWWFAPAARHTRPCCLPGSRSGAGPGRASHQPARLAAACRRCASTPATRWGSSAPGAMPAPMPASWSTRARQPRPRTCPLAPARRLGPEGGLGEGAGDYVGSRGYRPGDSPRHLDWKALARGRGLVVKQFGGEQAVEVWLDLRAGRGRRPGARLAALCRQVLDAAGQGLAFGLRLPGGAGPARRGRGPQAPLPRRPGHLRPWLTAQPPGGTPGLARGIAAATLLLAAAYLPLVRHLVAQVSAFVGVILLLRLAAVRWPALTPGRWMLLPLTLAGLGIAFDAYFSFVGRDAGTALLVVMLALKTLELRTPRDLRAARGPVRLPAGQSLPVRPVRWARPLPGRVAHRRPGAHGGPHRSATPAARCSGALRLAGTLTLQALPLALVLFLLFPRLSAPLWNLGNQQQRSVTGMSDSMEPGSVAELVISGEPAFRARFDGAAPAPGPALLARAGPVGLRRPPVDAGGPAGPCPRPGPGLRRRAARSATRWSWSRPISRGSMPWTCRWRPRGPRPWTATFRSPLRSE